MNEGALFQRLESIVLGYLDNLAFELVQRAGSQGGTFAGMWQNSKAEAADIGEFVGFPTRFSTLPSSVTLSVWNGTTPTVSNIWSTGFWLVKASVGASSYEAGALDWSASVKLRDMSEMEALLAAEVPAERPAQVAVPRLTFDCPFCKCETTATLDEVEDIARKLYDSEVYMPVGETCHRLRCQSCPAVSFIREHADHEETEGPEHKRREAKAWRTLQRAKGRLAELRALPVQVTGRLT